MVYTDEHLSWDLLKLAGAGALIGITNDPDEDFELRKQACDQFEAIARLPQGAIGEELVRFACHYFNEYELERIASGEFYEDCIEKTAGMLTLSELDSDTLEKVASETGTSPTAAKAVAHEIADSAKNVEAIIDDAKIEAQSGIDGGVPGGGYNVNNLDGLPLATDEERYLENVAAYEIEQAMLTKQAAADADQAADEILHYYGYQY